MKLRGIDLHLNVDFQYGLLHWMLSNDPMLKPNTRFVSSYLAVVGKLKRLCDLINLEVAWDLHGEKIKSDFGLEGLKIFEQKSTLILRPLKILFERPHLLMGWLALLKAKTEESRHSNKQNPVNILVNLYNYLRLEKNSDVPPCEQIWSNDQILLDSATSFYKDLESQLRKKIKGWAKLTKFLSEHKTSMPPNFVKDKELWERIISAHSGHQMSLELLQLPEIIGLEAGYYGLKVNTSLEVEVPEAFHEQGIIEELIAELDPAPPTRKNEILAWTGGTFYSRETPDAAEYVMEGQHVERGDVIGLLEVMKMFNQIRAEFSGTIRKICVTAGSGIIVSRGQQLFEIEPDDPSESETKEEKLIKQQEYTVKLMKRIVPLN
jgi:biotin carboxyl carrier protein